MNCCVALYLQIYVGINTVRRPPDGRIAVISELARGRIAVAALYTAEKFACVLHLVVW